MAKLSFGNDNEEEKFRGQISSKSEATKPSNSFDDYEEEKPKSALSGWRLWTVIGATALVIFALWINYPG